MGRLIDADKFAEKFTGQYEFMKRVIDEQPVVDAVEVVLCKDCKFNCNGECSGPFIVGPHDECIVVSDNDFCSYGERKNDGIETMPVLRRRSKVQEKCSMRRM